MERLSTAQVTECVNFCIGQRPGTANYVPEIVEVVEGMLPAMTAGDHLENSEMLQDCLETPLTNADLGSEVRSLSMRFSRALSTLAEGGSLQTDAADNSGKAEKNATKAERKKKKKNDKKKKKKAVIVKRANAAKAADTAKNENAIPMWLTDEAAACRNRARVR